jgi:hypothetical protein
VKATASVSTVVPGSPERRGAARRNVPSRAASSILAGGDGGCGRASATAITEKRMPT